MTDKNIERVDQQPSTSLQNQTDTTTDRKKRFSDDYNSGIISTNEVRVNYLFIFFSNPLWKVKNIGWVFYLLHFTFLKSLSLITVKFSRCSLIRYITDFR